MRNTSGCGQEADMEGEAMPGNIIDIHSHILPGVDDGAVDWDESREMLRKAYEQGIGTIIATPHFSRRQDLNYLRELTTQLSEEARRIDPQFQIYLGHEIMYFESVVEYLKEGKALTLAGSRYVLIEFRPNVTYPNLYQWIRKVLMAGYLPVIAHVERYPALRKKGLLQELAAAGCYLQMNYGSVDGSILNSNIRCCRKWVQEGYIDFLGTDMHHSRHRAPVIHKSLGWLEHSCDERQKALLTRGNAESILSNRSLG